MSQVYGAECNGCGIHTEMTNVYQPAPGWHRHTLTDLYGTRQQIDLCPACWPTIPFSRFIPAAAEERTSEPV